MIVAAAQTLGFRLQIDCRNPLADITYLDKLYHQDINACLNLKF